MELILIRHAEPVAEERRDGTEADPPLSAEGRAQALAVAQWLARAPLHRLVSSPALRSRQTAEAIATRAGLDITVDDRLRDANQDRSRYVPIEEDRARDREAYRESDSATTATRVS